MPRRETCFAWASKSLHATLSDEQVQATASRSKGERAAHIVLSVSEEIVGSAETEEMEETAKAGIARSRTDEVVGMESEGSVLSPRSRGSTAPPVTSLPLFAAAGFLDLFLHVRRPLLFCLV